MEQRKFNGIFIPKEIWLDERLNCADKCMLVEIESLDLGNGCDKNNLYFSKFLGLSESSIKRIIKKLKDLNLITYENNVGISRVMKVNPGQNDLGGRSKWSGGSGQIDLGHKSLYYNIYIYDTIDISHVTNLSYISYLCYNKYSMEEYNNNKIYYIMFFFKKNIHHGNNLDYIDNLYHASILTYITISKLYSLGDNLNNRHIKDNSNIIKQNYINNIKQNPTFEEIEKYALEKNYKIDVRKLYNYYNNNNWKNKNGEIINDWKKCVDLWNKRQISNFSKNNEELVKESKKVSQNGCIKEIDNNKHYDFDPKLI